MPIRPENAARYPADWKLRSYFVRFVRAKGRCEWCGVAHGAVGYWAPFSINGQPDFVVVPSLSVTIGLPDEFRIIRIVLTAAHVYDDRPEAASLLNLAALCQRCHNRHDMKKRRAGTWQRRRDALPTPDMFSGT